MSQVQSVLESLEKLGDKRTLEGMPRYGILVDKAYGVPMAAMQKLAKSIGKDHKLAQELWDTGWYDARIVACYVDEPEKVTAAQMDRWRRDFDNWGICDTVCFVLFDRTPHAFRKVEQWAKLKDEYGKRAAFALLACLALHDKKSTNEPFLRCIPLIEEALSDKRNFVKKGVDWALKAMAHRNPQLKAAIAGLKRPKASKKRGDS
jgi:3-methyladenine DNA glycosylase AlkD